MNISAITIALLALGYWMFPGALSSQAAAEPGTTSKLHFINTGFENASPLWYDFAPDGVIQVHLVYDHERSSPNRAAGHIHFQLQARPGSKLAL